MFKRSELKSAAKAQIKGNIGILFVCALIGGLIVMLASFISWLIAPAIAISYVMIYLKLTENVKPGIGDVFKGFSVFGKALWLNIITGFFVFMWSLLLVIPGIIKSFSYMMAPYILADNPQLTARQALSESKRITNGYKMSLFVLQLSFFGWILLGLITFGLAFIYISPYMQATMANAYRTLKAANAQA